MKILHVITRTSAICLLGLPVTGLAGDLIISVDDNLLNQVSGDAADRSATHQITTLSADSSFQRDGVDSASFEYVINGQVSADDGVGGADDLARLLGDVTFNFDLPTALWTIRVDAVFRGAQGTDGADATASAGMMQVSSSGSAGNLASFTLNAGAQQFFNESTSRTLLKSSQVGSGSLGVGLDLLATSNDVVILTGDEAYAGIGQFSTLSSFSTDDALDAINSLADDGAYITLTFTPSLSLSGQTLNGDLALVAGEVLSGSGTVNGDISGVAGSSILSNSTSLTLGSVSSTTGFDFSGTLSVGSSSVTLNDLDEAIIRGNTTLNGGSLSASNGILLENGVSLSGNGTVSGKVSGAAGSTIVASASGLTLGDASSTSGFDFSGALTVGSSSVTLRDLDEAILRGNTTLVGGSLSASNGILLESGVSLSGNGTVSGKVSGAAGSSIIAGSTGLTLGDAGSTSGFDFSGTLDVGSSAVTLLDSDAANLGTSTTLAGGILKATNGISIDGSDTVSGYGILIGSISGSNVPAGLLISAPTGNVNVAGLLELTSFETAAIYSQLAAELGSNTILSNATLIAANGISLGNGDTLTVSGTSSVDAAVTVDANAFIINNSGDVEIGDAASTTGFISGGTMTVNSGTLTINDADVAELGSSTVLNDGVLVAQNGISIDGSDTITGQGLIRGEISGTNAQAGLIATGTYTPVGALNIGADTVTVLTDTIVDLDSSTSIAGGTLRSTSGLAIAAHSKLAGYGSVIGDIIGRTQSTIEANGGDMTLGSINSFNGFRTDGEIITGTNKVTLNSAAFAKLGTVTTIGGGTLEAANGVFLSGGNVITGSGAVAGRISAEAGALINATGNLMLGDSAAYDGFFSYGNLDVNNHTVTLNDANEAKLGSLTSIGNTSGPGTLDAANGLVLNGGHNIAGYGLVTADLENQGSVIGQGPLPADVLELSGTVSGSGSYEGNILFSGTFSPGNSPAVVEFDDIALKGILEIEIGGLNPGSQYDVLSGTGDAILGGALSVSLINGFTPDLGDSFDILTADTILGEFDLLTLAMLGDGLKWDVDYIFDDIGTDFVRLSVSQVPLPGAVWLFGSGLIGLIGIARRRRIE